MGFHVRQLPMIATTLLLLLVALPMECLGFGMQVFVQPSMLGTSIARSRGMEWYLFGSTSPDDKGEDEDMFALYCEPDGFMSKETLTKVPAIAEMLVRVCDAGGSISVLPFRHTESVPVPIAITIITIISPSNTTGTRFKVLDQ